MAWLRNSVTSIVLVVCTAGPALAQSAKVQFIHASPDYLVQLVDIYVDGDLVVDDLHYAEATPYLAVEPGAAVSVAVADGGSTSAAEAYYSQEMFLGGYEDYYVVLTGLLDASSYEPNPDGLDTSVKLLRDARARPSATEGKGRIMWLNAVPDGPGMDFWGVPEGGIGYRLRDNIRFGQFSRLDEFVIANYEGGTGFLTPENRPWPRLFSVRGHDFSTMDGQQVLEVSIGFYDVEQARRGLSWMWVYPDGNTEVFRAEDRPANVQFYFASPDDELKRFDLWVDGFKIAEDVGYEGCTEYTELTSAKDVEIVATDVGATSTLWPRFKTTVQFTPQRRYQAVLAGVADPSAYNPNPSNRDVTLDLKLSDAGLVGAPSGNVRIRMFNAMIDYPAIDFHDGAGLGTTLARSLNFGQFSSWSTGPANTRYGVVTEHGETTPLMAGWTDNSALGGHSVLAILMGTQAFYKMMLYTDDGTEYLDPLQTARDPDASLPEAVRLVGNYPNPFNPSTEILFELPAMTEVDLGVFDVTGRRIATLVQGSTPSGFHRVTWDADGVPSGVYLYRLTTPEATFSRVMTLVK